MDRGIPTGEGMEAELMPPGRVANRLCPVERLGGGRHCGTIYVRRGERELSIIF